MRHPGRGRKGNVRDFTGGIAVEIGPDPFYECVVCNYRHDKDRKCRICDVPHATRPPAVCKNTYIKTWVIPNAKGPGGRPPIAEETIICDSDEFRDDVDIEYFKGAAKRNPSLWEVVE